MDEAITAAVEAWHADWWPWISEFLQSPGFGGAAALVAALVAYRAATRQIGASVKQHQVAEQQMVLSTWWQRAEWALDLYVRGKTREEREVGAETLEALFGSGLGGPAERDFVEAAMLAVTLDPNGDGDETDDAPLADNQDDGAYLEQEKGEAHGSA